MANKRTLKRSINLVCGELLVDCVAASLYGNDDKHGNADALLFSILKVEDNFIKRVSHPEPGMAAKQYYKELREQFAAQISEIADQINNLAGDAELVLLSSVFGQTDSTEIQTLQSLVKKPLRLVATLPPSVAGGRMQTLLRHYFKMLGGNYLMGDSAVSGQFDGDRLLSVTTAKLGDMPLRANNYVLATGSFISRGIIADYERVYEPIFDLDVDADSDREQWTRFDVLEPQAYSRYGVATDGELRCLKQGKPMQNLRAIGSVLSGHDAIKMGDGTGVSLLTALAAAKDILSGK